MAADAATRAVDLLVARKHAAGAEVADDAGIDVHAADGGNPVFVEVADVAIGHGLVKAALDHAVVELGKEVFRDDAVGIEQDEAKVFLLDIVFLVKDLEGVLEAIALQAFGGVVVLDDEAPLLRGDLRGLIVFVAVIGDDEDVDEVRRVIEGADGGDGARDDSSFVPFLFTLPLDVIDLEFVQIF